MKIALVLFLIMAVNPLFCQEITAMEPDAKEIQAPVVSASIYRGKALVVREADITLKKGENKLAVAGLPAGLINGSLYVYKKDESLFIIKEYEIRNVVTPVDLSDSEKKLLDAIEKLQDSVISEQDKISVLDKKIKFYNDLTAKTTDRVSQSVSSSDVNVKNVGETLVFVTAGLEKTLSDRRAEEKQLKTYQDNLAIARSQLSGLKQGSTVSRRLLFIRLDSNFSGKSAIGVKYIIPSGSWKPYYEADLKYDKNEIDFKYGAVLNQQSGEDWNGIKLILSTGSPLFDATLPAVSPWIIREYVQPRVYANMKSAAAPAPSIARSEEPEKEEAAVMPQQIQNIESGELGQNITLNGFFDIRGNGEAKKAPVFEKMMKVSNMFYTVVPSRSGLAYLTAELSNGSDMVIYPGEVTLYLDANYSAKSSIYNNINPGESMKLSFGVDEGIKVSKEVLQEKKGSSGVFEGSVKLDYGYRIKLENYKKKDVSVNILEPLPYSENDKIKVEITETSLKPQEIKDRGIYTWNVKLSPGEKKEIVYKFRITYPRDMNVSGL